MLYLADISEDTEINPLLDWKPGNFSSEFTNMVSFLELRPSRSPEQYILVLQNLKYYLTHHDCTSTAQALK